ncbi:Uncharacterised protein [Enterobacter cloacae]|nr:Uncharacterised protein [Enterobacter cloacae]
MAHLAESAQRFRADALRWGIGRNQFGVLRFQLAQFTHQAVIFRIRHFRCVHNMIEIFMMAKRGSQFSKLLFD